MSKLVSIVVPIYNVEDYIHKCVDSLLNQTYSKLEIILVDDGSPDNCPQICDDYSSLDNRVKVIHKENGGLSDARNAGMELATGEFIIFIDGDDYVELNMVGKAVEASRLTNSDVVIWGFFADYVDESETLLNSVIHTHDAGVFSKEEFDKIVVGKGLIGNLGYAWNKMYKLDFLRKNNFEFSVGLSLVEDIVFNSPVLSKSKKITFLDEPFNHYMQRPRVTLGTKYYDGFFEIKYKGIGAVENLLISWNQEDRLISKIIATLLFGALKTTISQLSKSNNLSTMDKIEYLNNILNEPKYMNRIENLRLTLLKDKIINKLIQFRKSYTLLLFYKLLQR